MEKLEIKHADFQLLAKYLYKVDFFSTLQRDDFNLFAQRFELVKYEPGETIFNEGERAHSIYIVYKGEVQVIKKKLGLLNMSIATLGPSDIFGEMGLLEKAKRNASVKTKNGAEIFELTSSGFTHLFRKNPAFKDALQQIANFRND